MRVEGLGFRVALRKFWRGYGFGVWGVEEGLGLGGFGFGIRVQGLQSLRGLESALTTRTGPSNGWSLGEWSNTAQSGLSKAPPRRAAFRDSGLVLGETEPKRPNWPSLSASAFLLNGLMSDPTPLPYLHRCGD